MTSPPLLPAAVETAPADAGRSSSGREHARRWRGLAVVAAAVLLVCLAAVALDRESGRGGTMDPLSYDPHGGRALATLLAQQGAPVTRLSSINELIRQAGSGATVVVAEPRAEPDLRPLRRLPAGATIVLIAPDEDALDALQPGLSVAGTFDSRTVPLDCDQPAAKVAGPVVSGGDSYQRGGDSTPAPYSCYDGTVFEQPGAGGGGIVDIGSADTLSNADLGRAGNAALGLGLLGHGPRVLWLVPGPLETVPATGGTTPLTDLLPGRLGWAVLEALLAVVLLMLWRARRLGRVVFEPLPVAVRASETVEGLGRLYRAGRSRGRAATVLRAATLARLAPRLGVRREEGTTALVAAVCSRTARSAVDVTALLYGAAPEDDAALVALVDSLDALEAEVRRS